ncbi:tripartite tricarboxylate transporter TctB family protein [Microvirga pakistanensis]|uniref:tripartite tricarboxylate transporter TctB family protein n=1 Tax=Microvirga pakistanensis TaxID=1682650 RepID=UPI00106B768E|nr:tripartite tricarboxylate transporter TctB family protein [Microvirga pakistanensis]
MKAADILSACVMLFLAVVVLISTRHLPYWADFAPGSAFSPFWVAAASILVSCVLVVGALRRQSHPPIDWPDRQGLRRVLLTAGGLWAIVVLAPVLGLVATAVLFMLFLLLVVLRRNLWPSLLTTAVTAALIYGVFSAWLGIAFPTGLLGI